MIESLEQLRKDADKCETAWIRKSDLLEDIDAIEREVEERYVERPADADGMVIAPSDNMVDQNGEQFMVSSIELLASGEWILYGIGKLGSEYAKLCHHKLPTVEDLLDEFASAYDRIGSEDEEHHKYLNLIAEYAAKLQLKGVE